MSEKPPVPPATVSKSAPLIKASDYGVDLAIHPTKEQLFNKQVEERVQAQSRLRGSTALFDVHYADEWMTIAEGMPMPLMLFDSFWRQGELCILFADTNVGKSILAVQIADSISRGVAIEGYRLEVAAQPVAYFDFELSARQFQARYTCDYQDPYPFSKNFHRAAIDPQVDYVEHGFKSFEDFLYAQLELYVENTGLKVLIIDNLSYLNSENEKAKDAASLMRRLNRLKIEYKVSLLVLAHTPKRDQSQPISENHLQGSKAIANLCDSIFAIGTSHRDPHLRYIKQIKGRTDAKEYEGDNVVVCQIIKTNNFLHFSKMHCSPERDHLRETGDKEMGQQIASVKDLAAKGLSQREISAQLHVPLTTVNRYLKK